MCRDQLLPQAFAVWHPDDEIRLKSSSGGAFTLFAETVLKDSGVVFGATWDENLDVVIVPAETREELVKFRGSKYVYSDASKSYDQVIHYLNAGRKVLYSAAPCQIAALKRMLGGCDQTNLLTVDFICHGTPGRKAFRKYINHLERKYHDKIVSVDFRDKRFGVETNLLLKIVFQRCGEKIIYGRENSYYYGFIHNVFLRKCCSLCKFNRLPRQADISLCDYRGLGEHTVFAWEEDKVKGFTGVLANTLKGLTFIQSVRTETIQSRPLDELTSSQGCLYHPSQLADCFEEFMTRLDSCSWAELERRYLKPTKRYLLYILARRILGASLFLRLGIIYKRLRGLRSTSWFLPKRNSRA